MTDSLALERRRRNPAPWILAAAIAALAVYYATSSLSGVLDSSA